MATVKKTSTEFEVVEKLENGKVFKVCLTVNHKDKSIDITPPSGGHFTFLNSSPALAKRIGFMIADAANEGELELQRNQS